ncbi:hypothetical protein [Stieleria mannarensis]|nr:hypothetical protein [Rhodopirellula sp. JC639]
MTTPAPLVLCREVRAEVIGKVNATGMFERTVLQMLAQFHQVDLIESRD